MNWWQRRLMGWKTNWKAMKTSCKDRSTLWKQRTMISWLIAQSKSTISHPLNVVLKTPLSKMISDTTTSTMSYSTTGEQGTDTYSKTKWHLISTKAHSQRVLILNCRNTISRALLMMRVLSYHTRHKRWLIIYLIYKMVRELDRNTQMIFFSSHLLK